MQLSYRGSVNRWECDENDHLNVRFYVEKHWQTLCGAAGMHGLADIGSLQSSVASQHLRFVKESRLAAPISGYAGIVGNTQQGMAVLTELRHSFTGEMLCACVHQLRGAQGKVTDELPGHAAPRGVVNADLPHAGLSLEDAPEYGFHAIGMGVVQAIECGVDGRLSLHNYMGRISDSMPHLWALMHDDEDAAAQYETLADETVTDEGGAVLEYRLHYHAPLIVGTPFTLMSGIAAVGEKVQNFAHLLFDSASGALCVSAQAAGVRMDLTARRAKALSPEQRIRLGRRLIQMAV